ncbi:MAG: wax ester/triacylglycerol synthase family O-acyltransferase [Actinomycetota bacterium]|nr:wax ester/triacylglycerol synthase family O-acyltransferase [Actinomycetota bacterium]
MRQLTSLDAQFLAMESARQYGHVAGLAILDPSTRDGELDLSALQHLIGERLPLVPPLCWRLAEVPFGLDYSYWVDDPDFDIEFHVREIAIPAPGSETQLAEQVARIVARPLDRARPLWELYLIHGLEEGHVAVLTKIHHAVIDGLSGTEIMAALLDLTPDGRAAPAQSAHPARMPSSTEMLGRGLVGLAKFPVRFARSAPAALPNLAEVRSLAIVPGVARIGQLAQLTRQVAFRRPRHRSVAGLPAPRTPFSGRVSGQRRVAFGQLDLADVKTAKNRHGTTVNDVVVAICAGAVRRWLIEHDALPADPLVVQIPISVRTDDQVGTYGNRIMLQTAPLLTQIADPVERLRLTHDALGDMKQRHKALPAELLQDANHFIPPAVFALAARSTFALATSAAGRPPWNLVISNVPGPQVPLYLAGARLVANYPISVITDGMGLNITVRSYCGHLDFGLIADRSQMPDVQLLMQWLRDELELLIKD